MSDTASDVIAGDRQAVAELGASKMVGGSIREDEAQARLERLAAEDSTTPAALEAPAHLSVPWSENHNPLSGEV